jgi:hypothetical protein
MEGKMDYSGVRKPPPSLQQSQFTESFAFDIETMGLPSRVKEFGKPYPDFVEPKMGNLKDPVKKQVFYEDKFQEWKDGEANWWSNQVDRAALDPVVGRVVAIGYKFPYSDKEKVIIDGLTEMGSHDLEEMQIIRNFWDRFTETAFSYGHIIGHNIEGFDLPFLMKRSWLLGVPVSPVVMSGRYFHKNVVDTMKVWCCHAFKETISLDKLAKLLNVGQKMDNYHALQFATDWLGGDKDTAEFYLRNDLDLTYGCYSKMYATS